MTETLPPPSIPFAVAELRRFTVAEYHAMIAAGVFADGEPIELLHGQLVRKMPRNSPHSTVISLLNAVLAALVPPQWYCRLQDAVTLDDSEPEPDLAVVRGPIARYARRHPTAADVGLVAEVSDSTVSRDRRKASVYAGGGIGVYWIVNIPDRTVEVYTDPVADPPHYANRVDYPHGTAVPVILDGVAVGCVAVADMFPNSAGESP